MASKNTLFLYRKHLLENLLQIADGSISLVCQDGRVVLVSTLERCQLS